MGGAGDRTAVVEPVPTVEPAEWLAMAVYAVVAYLAFLATVAALVAFLAGVGVPRTVDAGGPAASPLVAVAIDLGLVGLFGLQHSVMARPWWKRHRSTITGRSSHVLASSLVLALLLWQWRPIAGVVWETGGLLRGGVWALFWSGWVLGVAATFLIDHFELFGLRQAFLRPERPTSLHTPLAYRWVRHPIMTGFLLAFWAAPTMTLGRLLFAASMTAYVLVGVRFEEADLRSRLVGYAAYERATPRFLPGLRGRSGRRSSTGP